jgi:hypothetical protein
LECANASNLKSFYIPMSGNTIMKQTHKRRQDTGKIEKLHQLCMLVLNGMIVTNSENENGC